MLTLAVGLIDPTKKPTRVFIECARKGIKKMQDAGRKTLEKIALQPLWSGGAELG